jgi:hypothetical protein
MIPSLAANYHQHRAAITAFSWAALALLLPI